MPIGARLAPDAGMFDCNALLGRTFAGRFAITKKLGEGGMGTVFRAVRHGAEPADVAIKILHHNFAADPVLRARFAREAQTAAQVDHPNAVQILEQGEEDGIPYFVMELVEGRDLFDVLVAEGRLSGVRAAMITLQVCDAVATAHDRGIIHRDLKPENVMLTGDPASPEGERVKLLDFGVAKWVGRRPEDCEQITVAGTLVGTPAYMAPEQCLGEPVDARSDVYACGAVLYHLVTGRPPFEDECPFHTLYRHIHEPPRPPSELAPGLHPELEAVILRALAKRPDDRQQGASELWEELLATLPRLGETSRSHPRAPVPASMPISPREPTGALLLMGRVAVESSSPEARSRRQPRAPSPPRRWVPAVVGLAALASVAAALLGGMESPSPRPRPDPVSSRATAVSLAPR
jgi:serine/threonine-protein kinase